MKTPQGVFWCADCPRIPRDITARVDAVEYPRPADYGDLALTAMEPDFVRNFIDTTTLVRSTVTESSNPDVAVGDERTFGIKRDGRTEQEVIDAIQSCSGPRRGTIARILGQSSTCRAVRPRQ